MKKKLNLRSETIRALTDITGIVGGIYTNSGPGVSVIQGACVPGPSDARCNEPTMPNVCPMQGGTAGCPAASAGC